MWQVIPEFPDYSVSIEGLVRNDNYKRLQKLGVNQAGQVSASFMKDGKQYRRSVGKLVLTLFGAPPMMPTFDTVLHMDGDKENNDLQNLTWRPRWFVTSFHQEMREPPLVQKSFMNEETREVYENSEHVAMVYGVLQYDLMYATTVEEKQVWPTDQYFIKLHF